MTPYIDIKSMKLNQVVKSVFTIKDAIDVYLSRLELPEGLVYCTPVFRILQPFSVELGQNQEQLFYLFRVIKETKEYELIKISTDFLEIEAAALGMEEEYCLTHFKAPMLNMDEIIEIQQKIREEAIAAGEDPEQKIKENFDKRLGW